MSDPVAHIKPLQKIIIEGVLIDVMEEINRQDSLARAGKFGGTHILPGGPDSDRLTVLVEEVGEVAKEMNEERAGNGTPGKLYEELVQAAACAAAWATAHLEELSGYRPGSSQ
ncbi:hypothetical protein LCGC14_1379350 [marine sediment metagenome]|uniref:NTP pyrophosphohydrolase MazG putative catalytic core domain-containing protein n=1 Tax=marine sediment metagenome TaxID=412755 RepID=A0A0F9K382_9ZZZZ